MFKFRSLTCAMQKANESNLCYGFCILDGFYYVGRIEQLERIGCLIEG